MSEKKKRRLNLKYEVNSDLQICLATTNADLMAAHNLCYRVYLEEGYSEENLQELRLSVFHALPTTATFVAKFKGKVIGTLMAIVDSPMGLPSDNFFDLSGLRKKYGRIVEGSGYAIDKEFRGSGANVFFLLYKYFFNYLDEYLGADCTIAAINPKQKTFYNNVLLFEDIITEVVDASSANGAPAVLEALDLSSYQEKYFLSYANLPENQNLYKYVFEYKSDNHTFPVKNSAYAGYPAISPKVFHQLFHKKWALLEHVDQTNARKLRDIYSQKEYDFIFNSDHSRDWAPRRQNRYSSTLFIDKINGIKLLDKSLVKDVSGGGLLIQHNKTSKVFNGSEIDVVIQLESNQVELKLHKIWENGSEAGYKVIRPPQSWQALIEEIEVNFLGEMQKLKSSF